MAGTLSAVFNRRRVRRLLAGISVAVAAVIFMVILWFAQMGVFCVAPTGAACL